MIVKDFLEKKFPKTPGIYKFYNIDNEYDQTPDLNDKIIRGEIVELIYQNGMGTYCFSGFES